MDNFFVFGNGKVKYIPSIIAPDAAASVDKDQPGPSSQDRSDGSPGQGPNPAEG